MDLSQFPIMTDVGQSMPTSPKHQKGSFQRFLKTDREIESIVDEDMQNRDQSKHEDIAINSKTEKIPDTCSKFNPISTGRGEGGLFHPPN